MPEILKLGSMDPPLQKLHANICNHAPFWENGIRANQFSKASVIQRNLKYLHRKMVLMILFAEQPGDADI